MQRVTITLPLDEALQTAAQTVAKGALILINALALTRDAVGFGPLT